MFGQILSHSMKFDLWSATADAQLAAGTDLPASGSYLDVSPFERVHIICIFGVIHASDAPVLEPKCADAANGTLDALDTSSTLAHTAAADDDNEAVMWTIEVSSLPTDHHFLAVDVTGGATNGSYATVIALCESKECPVEQDDAHVPAASQYYFAGGQVKSTAGYDDA
jgi:hypothetical protein